MKREQLWGLLVVGGMMTVALWMTRPPSHAHPAPLPPAATVPVDGARLYTEACLSCHGPEGNGQNPFPIPGGYKPPALRRLSPTRWTAERLAAVIRKGDPPMPGWEGTLTPAQIEALAAYVRSLMSAAVGTPARRLP
jgi:mono/diheme cytochrome c family protein